MASLAWFVALSWLFILFVGNWSAPDWAGAGACAALAAALTAPLVGRGVFALRGRWRWAGALTSVPGQILVDFVVVTARLATAVARRDRGPCGRFVVRPVEAGAPDDAAGTAWRAFLGVAATWSPNAYVLDVNPERGEALLHDLVVRRASERPA